MIRREENARPATIRFSRDDVAVTAVDIIQLYTLFDLDANSQKEEFFSTAADEENNLDAVFVAQRSTFPIASTHHFTIKFNRDARGG